MTKPPKKKKPDSLSPEERQTAATVQSAREVLVEIDRARKILSDEKAPTETRRAAKRDMLEGSERLCNLMALAVYQITTGVETEFKGRMKASLDGLRDRLLDMGTNLMLEKLGKIHERAESVLEGHAYPVGLAARLDTAYSGIVDNLKTLGALDRLEQKDQGMVAETRQNIKTLAEIEQGLGVLDDMDQPAPLRR
jgi:hypothetical protein